VLARKNKISPIFTNLRSLLFLSFSLSFFLKTLWDGTKKEKRTQKENEEERRETNEDATGYSF
jgi:hypothetical protein